MKKVEINYNPYKMITTVLIDGVDVCKDGIPLQTWIGPIPYMDWAGFVNEISDPEINDEVMTEVCAGAFSGLGAMILDEDRIRKADEEELKEIAAQYGIRR